VKKKVTIVISIINGMLFKPLLNTPFTFIDIIIILLSGIITYLIIKILNEKRDK
jgi:hypothetical protein